MTIFAYFNNLLAPIWIDNESSDSFSGLESPISVFFNGKLLFNSEFPLHLIEMDFTKHKSIILCKYQVEDVSYTKSFSGVFDQEKLSINWRKYLVCDHAYILANVDYSDESLDYNNGGVGYEDWTYFGEDGSSWEIYKKEDPDEYGAGWLSSNSEFSG